MKVEGGGGEGFDDDMHSPPLLLCLICMQICTQRELFMSLLGAPVDLKLNTLMNFIPPHQKETFQRYFHLWLAVKKSHCG